jgi:TonB family protein
MKISVIFLASYFILSSVLAADPSTPSEMGKWWKDSEIVSQLRLTEGQVGQIEQRFLSYRPTLSTLNSELKNREEELGALMGTDPIDEAKVRSMTEQIALSRAELEKANSSMMIAIRQELTKEQWNKLQGIRELRRSSVSVALPGMPTKKTTPSGEQVFVVGGPVKAPRVLYQPMPQYTAEARDAKIEGIALLQGIIRKNGRITDLKVLHGLGYGLDQSAIDTISREWRFNPGTLNGQPVDVQANIEISFRLY